MDAFDTVFVQLFHYKADSVFSGHLIPFFRKAVEPFDDKSAKRIVIIRLQMKAELFVEIIQVGGTWAIGP